MMPATVHGMIPAALAGPGFIEHHRGSCRFGLMTRAKSGARAGAGLAQLEGSGVPLPKARPAGVPQSCPTRAPTCRPRPIPCADDYGSRPHSKPNRQTPSAFTSPFQPRRDLALRSA